MTIPLLLTALNEEWYIDDDIRCEPNSEVIEEYVNIVTKCKKSFTKAVKVYELLVKRNYIQDMQNEAMGFIRCYFYLQNLS